MATIAENLQTLNQTKQAIKTAIEGKGQDLTNVPFTEYADKIKAIESGDISLEPLTVTENRVYEAEPGKGFNVVTVNVTHDDFIEEMDKEMQRMEDIIAREATEITKYDLRWMERTKKSNFYQSLNLKSVELHDGFKIIGDSTFRACANLESVKLHEGLDNIQGYSFCQSGLKEITIPSTVTAIGGYAFQCEKLETVRGNIKNLTAVWQRLTDVFYGCKALKHVYLTNIGTDLKIGHGTTWGYLLTQESAIHLLYEYRNRGEARTITFSTETRPLLETVYVKSIPITDEMRAEDDLVDEKLPFAVCEPTDDGATLITEYVLLKNLQVAFA